MAPNTPTPRKYGKQLGESGTYIFGGYISGEEYNANLTGKVGIRNYDVMRRSDTSVRQALQVVKLPLLSAKWGLKMAHVDKDDPDFERKTAEAEKKYRYINHQLFHGKLKFKKLIKSLMSGLDFGFDIEEITLEVHDFEGEVRVGITSIAKRKQTSLLKWETEDGKPGITQQLQTKTVSIPADKLMIFSHDKEGDNYEGISLLRYAYKDYDIGDKLTLVNAVALEKQAIPIPKITVREGQTANAADNAKATEIAQNIRANERSYILEPGSLEISFMDMKGNTTKEILPTLAYHNSRVAKSVLAGFLEIGGSAGSGSQSLSKDLSSLFMKSEKALADELRECIEEQLIKRLCDINYSDMSEGYPELTVTDIADDDIAAIATALSSLTGAGLITPDMRLEDNLRDRYDLPALPDEVKEDYEEKRQLAKQAAKQALTIDKTDEKALEKETEITDKKQEKETKAAVIQAAKDVQRRIIDVIYSD